MTEVPCDVALVVGAVEIVPRMGPNGAGKTSLPRAIRGASSVAGCAVGPAFRATGTLGSLSWARWGRAIAVRAYAADQVSCKTVRATRKHSSACGTPQ